MKTTLLTFFAAILCSGMMYGQTFYDDFESYGAGDYLAASNSDWTTWGGSTGSAEDVRVSDEQAFSGTKSIKLFSTAASGGPQDLVKYFTGQKITTGVLNTSMRMLVETSAYFNYQGEVAIGTTWSMNAFFEAGGVGRITGASNTDVLTFDYPVGEWFDFNMTINFDANKWQLEVNGICVGSFANPNNSIASMDIYPVQGDRFFVDDFGYEYLPDGQEVIRDAIVELIVSEPRGLAGISTSIDGALSNGGMEVITSFEAEANIDGTITPVSMSGLNLANGDRATFTILENHTVSAGDSEVSIAITSINGGDFEDEDQCNDASRVSLFGLVPADGKKVIIEEATGTWCGWCPRGAVALERFTKRYPDTYIGVAVHNGDPMTVSAYDGPLAAPSYPNALVNRGSWIDPGQSEGQFLDRVSEPSSATILQGAEFDVSTRELKISLTLSTLEDISTAHKMNVVLTEDGVTGTTGYAQANYYSGSQDLIDIHGVNYRDLPDPIPADQMIHDHVARAILAPYAGLDDSFDETLNPGDERIFNFTYTVPADFDIDNMHIVSMLINPDGTINTGEGDSVAEATANGWVMGITSVYDQSLNDALNVYPNPMSDYTTVRLNMSETADVTINIVDMMGKIVMSKNYPRQSGLFSIDVDGSSLPAGAYVMNIQAGEKLSSRKISVVK